MARALPPSIVFERADVILPGDVRYMGGAQDAMPVIGAHLINKGTFDQTVCANIHESKTLVVGPNSWHGIGVYAYYADRVPCTLYSHSK